ncbi:hypothetical protein M3P05_04195 [Sansalvadorimonas sp. 2012CJ34-2]|uniref:Uncharacterized protein n=1 Tax=Parendozoicomonas callyspongiae TaxID=2942213 RepID=A0ABT0PF35_9GAMM|nr:hypothetical protein [Sansalvadorimonas sp. 2012CJ34-2]
MVFTTALFPQFIDITEPLLPQFLILVATFMTGSFSCLLAYSVLAQRLKVRSKSILSGQVSYWLLIDEEWPE